MRKLLFIVWTLCGLLAGPARGDTFKFTDNQSLTGDLVSLDEQGAVVRFSDGKYSERIPWTKFTQEDLKKLKQNPKTAALVEPFIELSVDEKIQRQAIVVKDVPRLERPPAGSLIGAMFSSSVGLVLVLVLYAANLYAAYEISIFRSRPPALVCGVAAVVPWVGPVVFLAMPTYVARVEAEEGEITPGTAAPTAEAAASETAVEEVSDAGQQPASGLSLAARPTQEAAAALPEAQVFQRGQYTFNRRFFETKFAGFFSVVRRDAEKDLVLMVKSSRGSYVAQRITRITGGEVHLHVQRGSASEEVMVPFQEVQEVQMKHKDA